MPGCLLQLVCSVEILHFVEGQQVCALGNHHVSSRLHAGLLACQSLALSMNE